MMQVANAPIFNAPTGMNDCGDPIASDIDGYSYAPFPVGSANVLTIDTAGHQTSEPIGNHSGKTQYLQVKAKDGAGIIAVRSGGAFWFQCVTGLK